jgi:Glycosyl transferase family 2
MVSFGIMTISYRREKILRLFLASIKRMRAETGINFPCVCVGDEAHESICNEYDVKHIIQCNRPVSAKFNTGVDYLMNIGCDYIVITGSDDIFSTDLLKNLIKEMEKGTELIGINSIYFYAGDGRYKGSLRKLTSKGQILGVARCIKRNIVEQSRPLWNKNSDWGMDGIALRNIMPRVKTKAIVDGICVDVKTQENLNLFSSWITRLDTQCPAKLFYDIMGEEEKQILNEI